MIKNKVKRILKTEEIDKILAENTELKDLLYSISVEAKNLRERVDIIVDCLDKLSHESKEYISLDYLGLKEKSKILVCGFFGARNLGDELMLQAILGYFEKKEIRATILLCDNYEFDASIYAPHDVVHYPKCCSDILELSKAFDTVIWAGGAHLDDSNYGFKGRATSISYSLNALSRATIKNGGDVIVLGVSSNEKLENEKYIRDLQFVIDNAKYFSLRDDLSLATLKNAGINTEKVKVIDDIALLNLDLPVVKSKKDSELVLGIVYIVTDGSYKQLGEYTNSIIKHLKTCTNKKIKILLIPFYDYQDNDVKGYKTIVDEYIADKGSVVICEYVSCMEDLEALFGECDLIISMRYHATLVASNMGIKTIVLDYSKNHRHYSNKNKYIQKKYNKELMFCDYGEKSEKLLGLIDEVMGKNVTEKSCQVDRIKNRLEDVLNEALGNLE